MKNMKKSKVFTSIIIIFIFIINFNNIYSQNEYFNIREFIKCDNKIIIEGGNNLKKGDLVFIIQMNGAKIDKSNTEKFGDILDFNGAGKYEFNEILDVLNNNEFVMKYELKSGYDFNSVVQFIKVEKNLNLNINQNPVTPAWNGKTGGVLVLYAENSINLYNNIDVSGKGFSGGSYYNSKIHFANTELKYFYKKNSDLSGNKGEGILKQEPNYGAGKGKNANGGGGGNAHNAGGGGGGNLSFGGQGGDPYKEYGFGLQKGSGIDFKENGLGGGISYYKDYPLIMGGGGGSGHYNNNLGSDGERGGGIVIIKSRVFNTNGYNLVSNGRTVTKISGIDAAGGGGGGGSFLLDVKVMTTNLGVLSNGGKGGSSNSFGSDNIAQKVVCLGVGGGGSGGTLYLYEDFKLINLNLNGGQSGIMIDGNDSCKGRSFEARDGEEGKKIIIPKEFNIQTEYKKAEYTFDTFSDGDCFYYVNYLKLKDYKNIKSIKWSNNSTKDSIEITKTGKYIATITDNLDCVYIIDTLISEIIIPNFGIRDSVFNSTLFRTGGNFKLNNKGIILTENKSLQVGHLWLRDKLNIKKGFTTNFAFRVYTGNNNKMFEQSFPGADGFALIFQNFKREIVGSSGGGIGFVGIPNSLAIEIDLFGNYLSLDNIYDPNGNHLAIFSNKEMPNIANHTSNALIKEKTDIVEVLGDSSIYYFNLNYEYENKKLEVSVSKSLNDFSNSLILNDFDFGNYIKLDQDQYSFIGISAATGTAMQFHEVTDWQLCGETKDNITGIEEEFVNYDNDDKGYKEIYPNPVLDNLNINNINNYSDIKIYNLIGNEIKNQNISNQSNIRIDISEFESGIYFYQLINEKTTIFGKFVKE